MFAVLNSNSPEIAQLDLVVLAQENVLRLHVAMHDAMRVKIVESRHELTRNNLHLLLGERAVVFEQTEQLPICIFGNDHHLLLTSHLLHLFPLFPIRSRHEIKMTSRFAYIHFRKSS